MSSRLARAALVVAVAQTIACSGSLDPVLAVRFTSLLRTHVRFDTFEREGVYLVMNGGDWAATWDRMSAELLTKSLVPSIDFSHSTVVIVASGPKPSSGFPVTVDAAAVSGTSVDVAATLFTPGNCVSTTALTGYVHVISVPMPVTNATLTPSRAPMDCR